MIAAAALAVVALSVSPAHVTLDAGGETSVRVTASPGLVLQASIAGLSLDGRGRPRIVPRRDAGAWLTVRPRTVTVMRRDATFVIGSRRPSHALPGDHTAIVLLTAQASERRAVAVGMRVGLVVTVRVPGRRLSRVEVVSARARRSLIVVTIANRGNVIEPVGGSQLQVLVLRRGRIVARFQGGPRMLLPRTRAVVGFRLRKQIHGPLVAQVRLHRLGGRVATRNFPLRL